MAGDISAEYTAIGRPYWNRAGVTDRIDLVLAPAAEMLDTRIAPGKSGDYDFAFIAADKTGYDRYYEQCLQPVRAGGLIVFDNTLWEGKVAAPGGDADTLALKALNDKLYRDPRVDVAMVPIGDGMTLARKH